MDKVYEGLNLMLKSGNTCVLGGGSVSGYRLVDQYHGGVWQSRVRFILLVSDSIIPISNNYNLQMITRPLSCNLTAA